jgi:predicted transcriptional regulator
MSHITISLSDERFVRLREVAKQSHLEPEELLRATIEEWLDRELADFKQTANYVLQKNAELYRRLA